jgi:hypothetical protein
MNDVEQRIRAAFQPYRSEVEIGDLSRSTERRAQRRRGSAPFVEESPPSARTSTRVVAALAALAVFAVVVLVFVVPAFRLHRDLGAGGGSPASMMPLWPARTQEGLQRYQDQADAGNRPGALDPQKVSESFAHDVLGWDQVYAVWHTDPVSDLCDAPMPGQSEPQFGVGCWSPGYPEDYSAFINRPGYSPPPVQSFALFPCEPGPCDIRFFSPIDVIVYQPLDAGPDGVWAVMSASNPWVDLDVHAGQTVQDGSTVGVSGAMAHDGSYRLGVVSDCGYSDAAGASDQTESTPIDLQQTIHLADTKGCSGSSVGYVWAAESAASLDGVDPLQGGGPPLTVFSAVPVTFVGP